MKNENQKRSTDKADLISILFVIGYLLIDFLPHCKTIDRVTPQYLYIAVLNIIIGIYCYAKKTMLPQSLILLSKNSFVLKIYVVFLVLCAVSIVTAGNISVALVSFTQLLIVFGMFANITILLYNKWSLLPTLFLIFGISVGVQSVMVLYEFAQTLDLSAIKGNTGNINILAASLNIKIPFLILGIVHFSNWRKIVLVASFLLGSTVILLTSSRATFLGLMAQVLIILVGYKSVFVTQKKDYLKLLYLIVPLVISIIVVNLIFSKIGDSERYKSIASRVSHIELSQNPTDQSAQLRLEFWQNALKLSAKNPVLGVGIGNWKLESLPYEKTFINDSDISSNAHNDFLELMGETGIVNGLVYFALFGGIFFINMKRILYARKKEIKLIAILCLMLVLSYGIDALFNFPLHIPSMQLGFCFLLTFTILNIEKKDQDETFFYNSKIIVVLLSIAVACLYFAFSQFRASQLEYKFKVYQAFYRKYDKVPENEFKLEAKDIVVHMPEFPSVSFYAEPFVEYVGVALYYEEKNDEALKYFKKSNKINPYLGNADWYIHKIELKKGNIDSAYQYAKNAFMKRPRNIDFYRAVLAMANEKKDTLEMLKIHDRFTKYRKMPDSWIVASNALQLSNYNTKHLIAFIDQGLKEFPNDSLLLAKKASIAFAVRDRYVLDAQRYGKEQKFDQAITSYKKALNEDPDNNMILQNLGICYFKLNQFNTSIFYLLKIVNSVTLNNGKTEYVLGVCYLNTKNAEKGCFYLNASKNKNFPGAEQLVKQYCK